MSDVSVAGQDDEAPVNPYNLLGAVNDTSHQARANWLIFLGVLAYVAIAVAGVTHRDLLLAAPVTLPWLGAKVPLTTFFIAAPAIVVLLHLGLVTQLTLLARKAIELDTALRMLETTDRRNHALRLELSTFFLTQAAAGPERSVVVSAFLHGLWWLTLVVLPGSLLLYIQAASSRFMPSA